MAKKVTGVVKLQIPAGAANPAPPVGPALGSAGVNIMQFCKEFNAKTAKDAGLVIPVIITVYQDRSFSLQFKSPPASVLLKKEAGLAKGSGVPNKNKVGKVTKAQLLTALAFPLDLGARPLCRRLRGRGCANCPVPCPSPVLRLSVSRSVSPSLCLS